MANFCIGGQELEKEHRRKSSKRSATSPLSHCLSCQNSAAFPRKRKLKVSQFNYSTFQCKAYHIQFAHPNGQQGRKERRAPSARQVSTAHYLNVVLIICRYKKNQEKEPKGTRPHSKKHPGKRAQRGRREHVKREGASANRC